MKSLAVTAALPGQKVARSAGVSVSWKDVVFEQPPRLREQMLLRDFLFNSRIHPFWPGTAVQMRMNKLPS